jgi:hypothetical protein
MSSGIVDKRLKYISKIYIQDGNVIKNRFKEDFNIDNEVNSCNNIVIETKNEVKIYCPMKMASAYLSIIENLYSLNKKIVLNCEM